MVYTVGQVWYFTVGFLSGLSGPTERKKDSDVKDVCNFKGIFLTVN